MGISSERIYKILERKCSLGNKCPGTALLDALMVGANQGAPFNLASTSCTL